MLIADDQAQTYLWCTLHHHPTETDIIHFATGVYVGLIVQLTTTNIDEPQSLSMVHKRIATLTNTKTDLVSLCFIGRQKSFNRTKLEHSSIQATPAAIPD